MTPQAPPTLHVTDSDALTPELRRALRSMLDAAYDGDFSDHDWAHALGGTHVWVEGPAGPISHASVVPRMLTVGGRRCRVGYVEAVATDASWQRRGHATAVMRRVGELIRECYERGVLSTGAPEFYERLGWRRWHGPSFVMTPAGREPTPDDDGGLMVLQGNAPTAIDLAGSIVADWREGDVW
jgi:aminoglycoside 2'-N-acetyltransferase I